MSTQEKITSRVVAGEGGCWIWTGFSRSGDYGDIHHDGRIQRAHRVSYEAFVGPIPEGLTIDHLCRVRRCVNPLHLEPVSRVENTKRGWESVPVRARRPKTHCKRGHEFTEENTYWRKTHRECRECHRRHSREWYASHKGS